MLTNGQNILFVTHAGDPGGAEYKMIDLFRSVRSSSEIMLLEGGLLEGLLSKNEIRFSVNPMPTTAREVRKEAGWASLLKAIPGTLSMIPSVVRKAKGFSVIVCISQKAFMLVSIAKPFTRRPVVWFLNDIVSESHFSRLFMRLIVSLSRLSADHIVLPSHASLKAWIKAGGRRERVSVIYPGLRSDISAQRIDPEQVSDLRQQYSADGKPLIGMIGRISRWKGQDVFLKAIARLPNVNAVIAGGAMFSEQEYEVRLKALARELGIENRVRFLGHVEDVISLIAACDVIAHCSTAPEPFGQVIVQAMFASKPVIASDAGGAPEVVLHGETGLLTPPNDDSALAAAIQRFIENPQWSQQLAQRAKLRAEEKFSGSAMTAAFHEILKTL
jgi:glycosyltransferase involved in cell wall biosynthesis